jgi:hypothetical protein
MGDFHKHPKKFKFFSACGEHFNQVESVHHKALLAKWGTIKASTEFHYFSVYLEITVSSGICPQWMRWRVFLEKENSRTFHFLKSLDSFSSFFFFFFLVCETRGYHEEQNFK